MATAQMTSETIRFRSRPQPVVTQTAPRTANAEWAALERQDWHLWIVAAAMIFLLGVSLLSFMFPAVFWFGNELPLSEPQRAFFGFSVLLVLALVYMLQRQATIRKLRRRLVEAVSETESARQQAAIQTFLSLPGMQQFRDTLAMEYRRASTAGMQLGIVNFTLEKVDTQQRGHISEILRRMLRRSESMYRLGDKVLALILPGMPPNEAVALAARAEEEIGMQFPGVRVSSTIASYPSEADSLLRLESLALAADKNHRNSASSALHPAAGVVMG